MNERRRKTFAALADVLVPEADGFPAASAAGAGTVALDRFLAALPELEQPLEALLDRLEGLDPEAAVEQLAADEAAFGLLGFAAAGGYLTEPAVLSRLGYRGRVAAPVGDDLDDEVLALLEQAIDGGPRYREIEPTAAEA